MANEALSDFIGAAGKVIYRGEQFAFELGYIDTTHTTNGTDIKPGMLVTCTGETHPDVDLCASTERPFGIVLEDPDAEYSADVDTAWDDGAPVRILMMGSLCEVWALQVQASAAAVVIGDIATVSADTAGTITNVDADWGINFVGLYNSYDTSGSEDIRIERVRLV